MNKKQLIDRIPDLKPCPTKPEARGLRSVAYPWDDMQPGMVFLVNDPSPKARGRLSAAATQAGRRLGAWFGTGPLIDGGVRVGWWCVRYDGIELEKPDLSEIQRRGEDYEIRKDRRRRESAKGPFRRTKIEPCTRIGDYAIDAQGPVDHVPADEADQWMRPREAGEVF